jgi:glycerol uptake facilitator-like aquaporin
LRVHRKRDSRRELTDGGHVGHISGCHLNPAVSLGLWAGGRFPAKDLTPYIAAQVVGAIAAAGVLYLTDTQQEMRQLFARYLTTRTTVYRNIEDAAATQARIAETAALQRQIWAKAVSASQRSDAAADAAKLLLPALNEMIDITTTRAAAMQNHPPRTVFFLLASLCLFSALLVGYHMGRAKFQSWFQKILFSATLSVVFFVILDLEYPRYGLIRIDEADALLAELRSLMQEAGE